MALTVERAIVRPYAFDLGLRTARGRVAARRGWHIGLEADGLCGWGDVAPWPGFGVDEAQARAALDTLDPAADPSALPAPVAHGLEQARLDLAARRAGCSITALLGLDPATSVASHRLVADADEARAAVADGACALKVKVAADPLADDDARVGAIRDAAPDIDLRLDANGGWDRAAAADATRALARHRPAWIEQPLPAADVDGLVALRRLSPAPLAVDESVARLGEAALALAEVAVIKPMFVGGLRRARDLARAARRRGLTVCITHALESPLGRLGALHLAAGLEGPTGQGVHGLGGAAVEVRGRLSLPGGPGMGWAPREAAR